MKESIVDPSLALDYLLFMMNKRKVFKYLEEYKLQDPTDDLSVLIQAANKKYCMKNDHNLQIRILNDYREGKLGRFTVDDFPKKEEKRRLEIKRKNEEEEKQKQEEKK